MTSEPSETPSTGPAVPVPPPTANRPEQPRAKIKIGSQRDTFPAAGPPLSPPRPAFKPQPVPPPPKTEVSLAETETFATSLPLPPAPAPVSVVVPLPEAQV